MGHRLSPTERAVLRFATNYHPSDTVRWPQHFFGRRRLRAWRRARARLVRLGLLAKAGGYYYEPRRAAARRMRDRQELGHCATCARRFVPGNAVAIVPTSESSYEARCTRCAAGLEAP